MSKLEDLIAELCPDGVEYKELGELGSFYGGLTGKSKEDFNNKGQSKYITYMNIFSNLSVKIDSDDFVQLKENEKQNKILVGDVLFTGSSETPLECGMSSVLTKEIDEDLYLNSFCFGFRFYETELFIPDFSKYLFRSVKIRKQIIKTASGVTRFNVSKKKMEKISIPIPPLSIQEEIVRILDKFTSLEAELEAELEARRQQYEYYRDSFLDEAKVFNNFEEIGNCCLKTENISWSNNKSNYKYVDLSSVNRNTNVIEEVIEIKSNSAPSRAQKVILENDVIFGTTRPTLKRYCLISKEYNHQICSTGFCVLRANVEKVLPRYIYYQISKSEFYQYVETVQRGSAYPAVSDKDVKAFKIPVPPLEEQERIVAILDRFDALVNDINQGIPAEIEARRKQYEYYRDKLLTFKEVV